MWYSAALDEVISCLTSCGRWTRTAGGTDVLTENTPAAVSSGRVCRDSEPSHMQIYAHVGSPSPPDPSAEGGGHGDPVGSRLTPLGVSLSPAQPSRHQSPLGVRRGMEHLILIQRLWHPGVGPSETGPVWSGWAPGDRRLRPEASLHQTASPW